MTGLDRWEAEGFSFLRGRKFGLLCNQATVNRSSRHIFELGIPAPAAIFGPQHGLWGHTQDNMIEWEGGRDAVFGVPLYSLYGVVRKPKPEWLEGLDTFVIDVPDIGSRYYTFAWTASLCMEACAAAGIPVVVLDRPNPLGGEMVEGPLIEPGYESFVGLHSFPIRHGLTLGELLAEVASRICPSADLGIVECQGWTRADMADQTALPWALPSPNMPNFETALVYPGACLLEGTVISEGRGTTCPFRQFGAPWLDAFELTRRLNALDLPGVHFRPVSFEPIFHKHGGQICQGAFASVSDSLAFRPVRTYVEALGVLFTLWKEAGEPETRFHGGLAGRGAWAERETGFWKSPPYEYETEKMPIDILWGGPSLRLGAESGTISAEHLA